MIDCLKPYPDMKDSGVEWLGDVPKHWCVQRLRNVAEVRVSNVDKKTKDDECPVRLCNYTDVYNNDRIRAEMSFMATSASADEIERFGLRTGDVLITKDSEAWNDIGVPALVESTSDDLVSGYHLALLRSRAEKIGGAYLSRCLSGRGIAIQFHIRSNGVTRYGLSQDAIKSLRLPLPPLPEQTAIVRFLDHADRRIRHYIRAREKLIALLEEQKQVLIHEAVTGRIDVRTGRPYPAYKPSGVEWLGELPAHWEVRRLRNIAEVRFSNVDKHSNDNEYPIRLCNYSDVYHNDRIRAHMDFMKATATADEIERFRLSIGDVIITKDSEAWDDIGVPALVEGTDHDLVCGYHLALLRPILRRISGEFLQRTLSCRSVAIQFFVRANGVTRFGLSQTTIKSVWLPIASASEQATIVHFLGEITAKADNAIARARREIDLLREYRARLIADVVTGKLDVREAAANLPEDLNDPDVAEGDCAGLEGRGEVGAGHSRRTEFPTAREEMIA